MEFDDPDADIIFRTIDNVELRFHKILLSLSSPFFKDMFSLPQKVEDADHHPSCPVIPVSEDSHIMRMFLHFCLPGDDPAVTSIQDFKSLMTAMQKYQMVQVNRLRAYLTKPILLEKQPLQVFSIAIYFGLEEEARLAARHSLRYSIQETPSVSELRHITGLQYHRLLEYHGQCGAAAVAVVEACHVPILSFSSKPWFSCVECSTHLVQRTTIIGTNQHTVKVRVSPWFHGFIVRSKDSLRKLPVPDLIAKPAFLAPSLAEAANCPSCRRTAYIELVEYVTKDLKREIERAILKVPLDLDL